MTVIRPNSVSGINSITAQANEIKIFKSDGTQGGLMIDGANLNATSGISTVAALTVTGNVSVGGTLTYQDVTNIDSVGIVTARAGVHVTGGNVAVGHNNPSVNLHVKGSASNGQIYLGGTGAHSQIYADNDGVLILNADQGNSAANSYLGFNVDNSERLRITSAGKIGINEATPDAQLHVRGSGNSSGLTFLTEDSSGNNSFWIQDGGKVGVHYYPFAINRDSTDTIPSSTYFYVHSGSPFAIKNDGAVVIGTDTAASNSQLTLRAVSPQLALYATPGNDSRLNMGDTDDPDIGMIAYANSDNSMRFTTNATERVRITSGGDVLIADTTNSVWNDTSGGGINLKANGQIVAKKEATSTADPLVWLNDTGQTTNKFIVFAQDGTEKSYIGLSGNDLLFGVNGGDRARIDSDGHLQIRREGVASMSGQDTRHTRYIVRQNNGQEAILGSVFAQGQSGWGGDLVFATKDNNGNPSSGLTERMRLDHNGKLIIKGESNAELNLRPGSGSGNDIISFENSGGTQRGNITYDTDNNFLFFNVSQSERTRIDQNGTLSHGTTQDNPGDANSNTGFAIRANGKYFFSCAADGGHMNRNNAGYVLHARYGGNFKGGVSVNSTQTNFNQTSDYRLKENIVNLDGAITRVKQLTPRRFNFIAEPDDTIDGFVAHEAATVVPESVTGTKDEVDSNGDPVYQGIDNGKLVPLLTAALQEAIAKIETLEAAVTALQGS